MTRRVHPYSLAAREAAGWELVKAQWIASNGTTRAWYCESRERAQSKARQLNEWARTYPRSRMGILVGDRPMRVVFYTLWRRKAVRP